MNKVAPLFFGITTLLLSTSAVCADDVAVASAPASTSEASADTAAPTVSDNNSVAVAPDASKYDRSEVFADFTHFQAGDVVPELYRSARYNIAEWNKRNLPAPQDGSHWTYMGGSYVLITDAEGRIVRIVSGDILYQ
ncbi:MAG: Nickel/cobalt homeostasis protein RcnB [Candidatus Erwinia impunctatus]|nr:Nickel/cobalt homeostasis protein RcnB [Culicoides impunctatus]